MERTALGMIETKGLLASIVAADAGLKAAEVRLLGTDYVRGGLVMVRFEGEVAAVQAAVDAGTAAAQRVGTVRSSHVIPRALPEVFRMLVDDPTVGKGIDMPKKPAAEQQPVTTEAPQEKPAEHNAEHDAPNLEEMKGWKVVALRSYVRKLPDFPLNANEIRYANKAALLQALEAYLQK